MKKGGKVLLTVLSAAALVVTSVIGTIAYFTDSESVVNTFTVGRVKISMDESDVTADGEKIYKDEEKAQLADRVIENDYHLIPGHRYDKDPIVHVTENSEDCYVFVTVKNEIEAIEWNDDTSYTTVEDQMITGEGKWDVLVDEKGEQVIFGTDELKVYVHDGNGDATSADYKKNVIVKSATKTDLIVFEEFRIDGDNVGNPEDGQSVASGNFDLKNYNRKNIIVTAYAVQADGFDTALAAWEATFGRTE